MARSPRRISPASRSRISRHWNAWRRSPPSPARLSLSTVGVGPVTAGGINGEPGTEFDGASVTLRDGLPNQTVGEIALGGARLGPPARVPAAAQAAADQAYLATANRLDEGLETTVRGYATSADPSLQRLWVAWSTAAPEISGCDLEFRG